MLIHSVARIFSYWTTSGNRTLKAVGMIASASLMGTMLAIIGSLVQAHFISPVDLGFIRKYSVVAGYAVFLNLGLNTILQRDYPVLMGSGEQARARRTASIVQSWTLLASAVVCGALLIVTLSELFQGHWREASAWFIQVVAVWSTLYVGYLSSTYRSGQEFERLAKGQMISSIAGVGVIPLFYLWPFPTLILRSVVGSILSFLYLYNVRPVKVGWCLPWREFLDLVKRGMRLYVSDYLRYIFWLTFEILLMYRFAGNAGVGLFVFSRMIAEAGSQLSGAINHVYLPQLAQKFGQTGSIGACIQLAARPTFLNLCLSLVIIICYWNLLPPVISYGFPKYSGAIPLIRILVLQTLVASISLPMYLVTLTESYLLQLIAVISGLGVFIGTALLLQALGYQGEAVAYGTLAGQITFASICFLGLLIAAMRRRILARQKL